MRADARVAPERDKNGARTNAMLSMQHLPRNARIKRFAQTGSIPIVGRILNAVVIISDVELFCEHTGEKVGLAAVSTLIRGSDLRVRWSVTASRVRVL